ncbi:hypothetical protein GCM10018966_005060 [Streptomyces yanii]
MSVNQAVEPDAASLLGHHALDDEVDRLAEECGLQPVGDETRHLLAQHARLLAERRVEVDGALHGLQTGLLAPDDLHQRNEVRRVEGMADDESSGLPQRLGDVGGADAGRGAEQQGVGGSGPLDAAEQVLFDVQTFGAVLLDGVCVRDCPLEVGLEAQIAAEAVGGQAERAGRGPPRSVGRAPASPRQGPGR